jgi:hypothetical protein
MSLKLPVIKKTINDYSFKNIYKYVSCVDEDHRNSISSDKDYSKYFNSLEHTCCDFIFMKGKKKGEICGKRTTDGLGLRCSQHKFS